MYNVSRERDQRHFVGHITSTHSNVLVVIFGVQHRENNAKLLCAFLVRHVLLSLM